MNEETLAKVFQLNDELIAISKIFKELGVLFNDNERSPKAGNIFDCSDKNYTLIKSSLYNKRKEVEKELELL
jgi:hypothetical protein